MVKDNNDSTFVKITNKDIYQKLCDVEDRVKITNGKVKLNRWLASTALTLVFGVVLTLIGASFA